jgi:hypothetical protein
MAIMAARPMIESPCLGNCMHSDSINARTCGSACPHPPRRLAAAACGLAPHQLAAGEEPPGAGQADRGPARRARAAGSPPAVARAPSLATADGRIWRTGGCCVESTDSWGGGGAAYIYSVPQTHFYPGHTRLPRTLG